jgi:hypothetical protein
LTGPARYAACGKSSGFSWLRGAGWAESQRGEGKEIFYFFFFFSNISKPFSNSF